MLSMRPTGTPRLESVRLGRRRAPTCAKVTIAILKPKPATISNTANITARRTERHSRFERQRGHSRNYLVDPRRTGIAVEEHEAEQQQTPWRTPTSIRNFAPASIENPSRRNAANATAGKAVVSSAT